MFLLIQGNDLIYHVFVLLGGVLKQIVGTVRFPTVVLTCGPLMCLGCIGHSGAECGTIV